MVVVLGLCLVTQIAVAMRTHGDKERVEVEAAGMRDQIARLQQRFNNASAAEILEAVAGLLTARNRWVDARCRSPARVLSKLARDKPAGVRLLEFEAKPNGGALKLASPDMDTAARFLNAAFARGSDRLTLDERRGDGLVFSYTWTD